MQTSFDPKDTPLPVSHYQTTQSVSRTTIWRWEALGLPILHVGGKRFIKPSDWTAFLEKQNAKKKEEQS